MKKIGIFFWLSNYGGVQTCVISLVRGLNNIGIVPDLLSDMPVNQKILNEFALRLNPVKIKYSVSSKLAKKLMPFFQGALELVYFFKTSRLKKEYDFLYIFTPHVIVNKYIPHLYYLSMSPRAPGFSGRKILPQLKFLVYDYFYKYLVPAYEIHGTVDNYVINSQFTAEIFNRSYGQEIKVVYPSNLIKTPSEIDYNCKSSILFLSRLVPEKRPELFIHLAEKFPEEDFVMIGTGENQSYIAILEKMIHDKSLANLRMFKNIPFNEIIEHLKKAKIYVFPAINEHFGITTVEAMMFGVIPFVHDSGGQREIVPWDNLRFNDSQFIDKFSYLVSPDNINLSEIRSQIIEHVKYFSEENYQKEMLTYIY